MAGELKDNRRKAENVMNRYLITLDADDIEAGKTQNVVSLTEGLGCGYAIYSTRKHSNNKPRLRIIIPLDKPVTPEEYEPIARKIASFIGMEIMDPSTFEPSRLMYWPSCSKDSEFVFKYADKPFASSSGILGMYKNWRDTNEWPKIANEPDIIKREVAKQKDPLEKDNIIGAFCKVYDIDAAIGNFLSDVYEHGSKADKYTYLQGSVANGATVYGDGKWLYSFHATDPASRTLCNSFDLVRIHKFGHLDEEVKEGTPTNRYPSYRAMCEFIESLPEIKEYKHKKVMEELKINPETKIDDLFFENGKFQKEKFCEYLIENEHIISLDGRLHIYDDGVYVADDNLIQLRMVKLLTHTSKTLRNECLEQIRILLVKNNVEDNINYIAFKNGLFSLKTKELIDFNPSIVVTNLIPHDYDERAYSPILDSTLNKLTCNDKELRTLLEEMIGYVFYRSNRFKAAFFLLGELANNGKSTFLELLMNVLGEKNYTALGFDELGHRFKTAELAGKLANIGDDIGSNFISDTATFKKLSSGNTIMAERKGKDPFPLKNFATLIFSANELPRTNDKSNGTATRMRIIPFNAVFRKTDPDFNPFIGEELKKEDALEYTIALGVRGLLRLIENKGKFTETKITDKAKEEYEEYNNTVIAFLKDKKEEAEYNLEDYTPIQVYEQYKLWCQNNNLEAFNSRSFGIKMRQLGYERKVYKLDGKLTRKYIKSSSNK